MFNDKKTSVDDFIKQKVLDKWRLKPQYTLSLGDSVVAAECMINNDTLITGDHKDFEPIKKKEKISINWFR